MLQITPVERAVLQFLADGNGIAAIADRLGLTEQAVESLLPKLYERMGAADRREAVAAALRRGLLNVPPVRFPAEERILEDRILYV